MVSRISSYTISSNLFNQTQRLQAGYATASLQSSSGLKSENFEGISENAQRLLTLYGENNNLTGQSLAIKSAQIRVGALQNITNTISETLNKVSSLLISVQNGLDIPTSAPSNVSQAQVLRDALVSLLNSQVGGAYLFGGSAYDRPPVDITDPTYTPNAAPGTPDTNYYQGDNVIDSVRASDTQRVDYGITANNPGFEKALRALEIYIANPTNTTIITQAYDLNRAAINDVAAIQGDLLSRSNVITDAGLLNEATSAYLLDNISTFRDVDIAAAATQISQFETQLQASFSSLSKLLQLRLTDYLR